MMRLLCRSFLAGACLAAALVGYGFVLGAAESLVAALEGRANG